MAMFSYAAVCAIFAQMASACGGHGDVHGPAIEMDQDGTVTVTCWRLLIAGSMVFIYFAILIASCMGFYSDLEEAKSEKTVYKYQISETVHKKRASLTENVIHAPVPLMSGLGA